MRTILPRRGLGLVACVALVGCMDEDGDAAGAVYASWAASPQAYSEMFPIPGLPAPEPQVFDEQSLRQVVRLSAGGDRVRVRLSNIFGEAPVSFSAAGVARSLGGSDIDVESNEALTFAGAPGVTVAAGQEVWSDFIQFPVDREATLAVTLYFAEPATVETVHSLGQQTAYLAIGNAVTAAAFPEDDMLPSYYWLTGVDVTGSSARQVVVTFGDSITDGFASTVDASHRYPNYLSERLTAAPQSGLFSVVNAGISGNRTLSDVVGPSGVSRFARDVLGQSGVTDVLILLGINDIGFGGFAPAEQVSADAITQGLASLVQDAHAADVNVYFGTLLPFQGTMAPYYSEAGEAQRQAVNAWIRANPEVSGVIDFDAVMRDSQNPLLMQPAFDSGDHLHPNDRGYEAMADAIDPSLFD